MFLSLVFLLTAGPAAHQTMAVKDHETIRAVRQPSPSEDAVKSKFSAGEVALTAAAKSNDWVVMCATPAVLKELALSSEASKKQDEIDSGEDAGVMLMLPTGLSVVVMTTEKLDLPAGTVTVVKVRVTDHDNRGRIGWLFEESLRPLKYVA